MAEWFKRGTVNTFYRGSNPLKALIKNKLNKIYYTLSPTLRNRSDRIRKTSEAIFV